MNHKEFVRRLRSLEIADAVKAANLIEALIKQRDQILSRSWTQTAKVRNQNRYNAALDEIVRGG